MEPSCRSDPAPAGCWLLLLLHFRNCFPSQPETLWDILGIAQDFKESWKKQNKSQHGDRAWLSWHLLGTTPSYASQQCSGNSSSRSGSPKFCVACLSKARRGRYSSSKLSSCNLGWNHWRKLNLTPTARHRPYFTRFFLLQLCFGNRAWLEDPAVSKPLSLLHCGILTFLLR